MQIIPDTMQSLLPARFSAPQRQMQLQSECSTLAIGSGSPGGWGGRRHAAFMPRHSAERVVVGPIVCMAAAGPLLISAAHTTPACRLPASAAAAGGLGRQGHCCRCSGGKRVHSRGCSRCGAAGPQPSFQRRHLPGGARVRPDDACAQRPAGEGAAGNGPCQWTCACRALLRAQRSQGGGGGPGPPSALTPLPPPSPSWTLK